MTLRPHTEPWYDRLSTMQKGYYYPWRSYLNKYHGEDLFRTMVFDHLRPELDVLEIACAQGELALAMAPQCHSVLGYDIISDWIEIACKSAMEHDISNANFLRYDSSPSANGGRAHLPVSDHSIDLFVSSKGPFHWIEDVPLRRPTGVASC